MSYASIRLSLKALLHFLFAMYSFTASGFVVLVFLCRCLNSFATFFIVVGSYAFLCIQSIVLTIFISTRDAVLFRGDDDAVPV